MRRPDSEHFDSVRVDLVVDGQRSTIVFAGPVTGSVTVEPEPVDLPPRDGWRAVVPGPKVATIHLTGAVRPYSTAKMPDLDPGWHGDAYAHAIKRSNNVVRFWRGGNLVRLGVAGTDPIAEMSADEAADLAANLWAAAKAARADTP